MTKKISILSTAPLGKDAWKATADMGIDLDVLSFIDTVYVADDKLVDRINDYSRESAIVVFTSKHAVMAVAQKLPVNDVDWQIYCLGNKTFNTVSQYFIDSSRQNGGKYVVDVADDAERLAGLIIKDNVKKVVFFCGDKRMDTLPEILKKAGVAVDEVVVYRTIETSHVVERQYDGILFFSPSGVSSFFNENRVEPGVALFAIGQTTADKVREYTANAVHVSASPVKQQVLSDSVFYLLNN